MKEVKRVVAADPVRQLWKMLRLYLDAAWVGGEIRRLHSIEPGKHEANVKKQAEQIGYCIRQAEEYFQASEQVGLATRPLLLYYGATALGKALYLLKLDGEHSFDALRKAEKHQHHGLELNRGQARDVQADASVEQFFGALQSEVYPKPTGEGAGQAWGHFALFYGALGDGDYHVMRFESRTRGVPHGTSGARPLLGVQKRPLGELLRAPLEGLRLLGQLPDLYPLFTQLGVASGVCRGSCNEVGERFHQEGAERFETTFYYAIDADSEEQRARVAELCRQRTPGISSVAGHGKSMLLALRFSGVAGQSVDIGCLPPVVNDVHGQAHYVLEPDSYVVEPAAQFALLFSLGMLARYFPDVWVPVIEGNVRVAEVTDAFLNVAYRKFPNLILDQMRDALHVVQQGAWSN